MVYQVIILGILGFGLVILLSLIIATRRLLGIRRKRREQPAPRETRCPCGYELSGLDTIRCPECGRVIGFDATPEDLGLTSDQLRRAKQARDARDAAVRAESE